jgi:tRNA-Thr(GGU) m(6)t(6)A37 methyltransferase TsaA
VSEGATLLQPGFHTYHYSLFAVFVDMTDTIKFIGRIQSELKRPEDCPLQENENAPPATLHIFPEFITGIKDLAIGSEVIILTWLHRADRSVLSCFPRSNSEAPHLGVFSTRSPDRPNPIGLHRAKIVALSAGGLISLSGLEVIHGTPVIDIKPVW